MKRLAVFTATLAMAALFTAPDVWSQPAPRSSVPNLLNFQGRLTDNVGNPVADGPHAVDFYIFFVRTGGTAVWSESQTPTTTGGLFTTQLGLANPLPVMLFQDYDSLFLEIVADGQTISPRTHLTSAPYSRAAGGLEARSNVFSVPETLAVATNNYWAHSLSTYGTDGQEQIRLWGNAWGEVLLFDGDPTNDLNVVLSANPSTGGSLTLLGGPSFISLNAQSTGDASALLPANAINSGEILDEPGVSNSDRPGFFFLSTGAGTVYVIDSVDITIPAAGYVEVTNDGYLNLGHTTGASSSFFTTLSKTRGDGGIFAGTAVARVPAAIATSAQWAFPMSSSRLFVEGSPGTYRYYLMIRHETGTNTGSDFNYTSLRARYFPTLYGTTVLAKTAKGTNGSTADTFSGAAVPASGAEVTTITAADHNARLEAERAKQIAELEARIKQLEEQSKLRQNPSQQSSEYPGKER